MEGEEAEWEEGKEKREDEVMRVVVEGCGGGRKDCQGVPREAGADRCLKKSFIHNKA